MNEDQARAALIKLAGSKAPELAFVDSMRSGRSKTTFQAKYNPSKDRITITRPMLADLQNEHELAFLLGHELGHRALKHGFWNTVFSKRDIEKEADAYAVSAMLIKGYNVLRVPWWFERRVAASTGVSLRKMVDRRNAILDILEGAKA